MVVFLADPVEQEARGAHGITWLEDTCEYGISYKFDFAASLRLMVQQQGMVDIAKTGSIEPQMLMAVTMDGARFTADLSHVAGGLKDVDPRIIDPISGQNLSMEQSRDKCYVFQITFGKDSSGMYDVRFMDFFDFFDGLVVCPATEDCPELSNFYVVTPQDLKSLWTCLGLGGAGSEYFCFCCDCDQDHKHVYKKYDGFCKDYLACHEIYGDVERCYCYPVNDGEHLEELHKLLSEYSSDAVEETYRKLREIRRNSKIKHLPTQVTREKDPLHIDFKYQDYGLKHTYRKKFSQLINDELMLRLDQNSVRLTELLFADLDERIVALKDLLAKEDSLLEAKVTFDRLKKAKWFTADQAVPCGLHLKMRVIEKIFWGCLLQKFEPFMKGNAKVRKALVEALETYMNTEILGSKTSPSQWRVPLERKKGKGLKLEPRNMTGGVAEKCIHALKDIVSLVYSADYDEDCLDKEVLRILKEDLVMQWHQMLDHFLEILKTLDRNEDIPEDDDWPILEFHYHCNKFMQLYCDIFGDSGITNYIHLLGAGHITYYLRKRRNLAKFSQEGWEALNQLLKSFYFHNTNHGGFVGRSKDGDTIKGEHLKPLVRLIVRRLMWLTGLGDKFFLEGKGGLPLVDGDGEEEVPPVPVIMEDEEELVGEDGEALEAHLVL